MLKKKPLNIIFAGTPQFSAEHLYSLIKSEHKVLGVLTKSDKPVGRGRKITKSPVKKMAEKYNIPVLEIRSIKNKKKILKTLKNKIDIMIVVAYGVIIPKFILNIFPMGCINIHASLLPKWRGPAPIQWSILNEDKKTGITIINMDKNIDTGNILYKIPCKIEKKETTNSLTKKLCNIGIKAMLVTLKKIQNKKIKKTSQNNNKATYALKIKKKMGKLNFFINAKKIEYITRAFNPWPGTYLKIKNKIIKILQVSTLKNIKKYTIGEIIKINNKGIQIQTIKNIINIEAIQIPGKKIIKVSEFIKSKQKIFKIGKIINNRLKSSKTKRQ